MTTTVVRARREDAFACAALRLQMDLEAGEPNRPGFITEYADGLLARFDDMPVWLATAPDGAAVGMVQASLVHRLASVSRPARPWLYIGVVFVTPQARGEGLGERMLRTVDAWADAHDVERMMLNANPQARSLYERAGFGAPPERLMYREGPFHIEEDHR